MTNLQNAKRFEDLLGADIEPAPYEFALLFKADGWLDRMRSKNRFKLLRAVDAKLRTILHEGERVYFATSGTTANFAEQYIGAPDENGEITEVGGGYFLFAGIVIAIAHVIDAIMTRHFALKGHHPA